MPCFVEQHLGKYYKNIHFHRRTNNSILTHVTTSDAQKAIYIEN